MSNLPSQTLESLKLESGIRERYLENINGLRVHILESGFEAPNRPALLLLHGFPDLAYCWRKVMVPLAAAGFHVIAPDQRGYGRTTGWDGRYDGDVASFRNHSYARDAIGITMALGHREVACIVGHDFGAAVAAYCALARPDYFRSLILMSPFGGVPALPFGADAKLPEQPSQAQQLAALNPPRKESYAYFSAPSANNDMLHAKQGVSDFLRAYFFLKSADNPDNHPHPLPSASATELAKLPAYYVMELNETMATTVAPLMPTKEQVAKERWLPASELEVYASEFERTGFQGGLNWYRCNTDGTNRAELELFSGRTIDVPACFIAGEADWGIYRQPGALEAMQTKACTHIGEPHIIHGAGHWVQQERPKETSERMLAFLKTAFASGGNNLHEHRIYNRNRGYMADTKTVIEQAYSAFNKRDIDGALALMTHDVSWPKASEGGKVVGKEEIRAYWTRQWGEFDPHVEPLAITERDGGKVRVRVHQLVKGLQGDVLSDSEVLHVFTMNSGLIAAMDLGDEADPTAGPSSAFAHRP